MKDVFKLTLEEIKQELKHLTDVESGSAFLYFCENYVKVSHPSKGSVSFKDGMYNWQKKAAVDFIQNAQIISKKTRQIGFSTTTGAYALWRALFFKNQNIVILSLTQRDSSGFLKRVKFVYDSLPPWLKQETSEFAKTTIEFAHNGSKITAIPNTENPARGGSLSLLIVDEYAAFKNPKALLAAAVPALSAGMLTPFSNLSLPSQFFIISTLPQNPIDSEYLRLLHYAQDNPQESEFKLIDVSVDDIPQYQDDKWHQRMRESLGERIYKIEILGQEVYDVENSLLPAHVLEGLETKPPIRMDFVDPSSVDEEGYFKDLNLALTFTDEFDSTYKYVKGFWVWEDPIPDVEYVMVCDVASGRANDFSTIEIFKLSTYEQVAEYRGKANLEYFKDIIELLINYYNNPLLSIESTGLGQGVVDYFSENLNYPKLYWHQSSKKKIVPGFPMSTKVRPNAIAIFNSFMTNKHFTIYSIRLINEMKAFGYTKTGRIEGIGTNDDLVMTIVQLSYLIKIGWAVSTDTMQELLIFGQAIKTDVAKEKTKDKPIIQKYYEKYFDVELDEETIEFLKASEDSGCGLEMDMESLINNI